ncbi:mannitol-1-phosphate 5-dehydrogenase [Virgibacillus senegalensis]|uniref:mannitol-1-phosphate 5-dehydrogenase n=1 Tax=Virgibacillus senegalensis TaxID=1499679 RepID=UPI00069E9149|nr:mannitol-1-phosphate 5-dehydrogenase [Virgibacillus senegalensis]
MKALHFGAGNIGRGFIGYLLNQTGYEVCFADINQDIIGSINKNNGYRIELLDDNPDPRQVSGFTALNSLSQKDQLIDAIIDADLITTSIGVNNFGNIAEVLAEGLLKRLNQHERKLDIIANENAINASTMLKKQVEAVLSESDKEKMNRFVGFPNAAVDRLALSKVRDGEEVVQVEPFCELVINKSEMVNHQLPPIKHATYVDDLKPYIERKLYIVNLGHAATAYIGFLAGKTTIQQTLSDPKLEGFVRKTLREAAQYIIHTFGVDSEDLEKFIHTTLDRFKNENVSDDIFRVARDPIRKLGLDERLIKPTRKLYEMGLSTKNLCIAIAAAFLFDNPKDVQSAELQNYISEHGIAKAILHFTKLDGEMSSMVEEAYTTLKKQKQGLVEES